MPLAVNGRSSPSGKRFAQLRKLLPDVSERFSLPSFVSSKRMALFTVRSRILPRPRSPIRSQVPAKNSLMR
jgi:hypothetical protein